MPCTASGDTLFWLYSYEVSIPTSGNTCDGWEQHRRQEMEKFKHTLLNIPNDISGEHGNAVRNIVGLTEVAKFYPIFRLPLGDK